LSEHTDLHRPSVTLLTTAACGSLLVYASTSALFAVSLKTMGDDIGFEFARKGMLSGARTCVLAISTFSAGYVADRIGKKWLLAGSMIVIAGVLLGAGYATHYAHLVIAAMLLGASLGNEEALLTPLFAELHPRTFASRVRMLHGFYPTGAAISYVVVGCALAAVANWHVPFRVAAIFPVLVAVMFMAGRYPDAHREHRPAPIPVRDILGRRAFWGLAAAMFFTAGAEGGLFWWMPNFIQDNYGKQPLAASLSVAAFGVAMAVGRFTVAVAARRRSVDAFMLVAAVVASVCAMLLQVKSFGLNIASLAVLGVFSACFWPGILALGADRISRRSGTMFGLIGVTGVLGFGLTPAMMGLAAQWAVRHGRSGPRVGLALIVFGLVAAAFTFMLILRHPPATSAESGPVANAEGAADAT